MVEAERIALISDVHGNLTALEAVLADIDSRGITRIFNLGDYVGKGPRGREVVALCQERCEVNLLGNWDDFVPDPDREFQNDDLTWWNDELGPGQGAWLRGLDFNHDFWLSGRRVRLFHAKSGLYAASHGTLKMARRPSAKTVNVAPTVGQAASLPG